MNILIQKWWRGSTNSMQVVLYFSACSQRDYSYRPIWTSCTNKRHTKVLKTDIKPPTDGEKQTKHHEKTCVFHLTLDSRQKMGHWKNKKGKVGKHNLNVWKYVVIMIVKVYFLNKWIRKNPPYENKISEQNIFW